MAVRDKAQKLADIISETNEYKQLKKAERKMQKDKEAQLTFRELQATKRRIKILRKNGVEVKQRRKNKLQTLHGKIQKNPKIKEFMEAQDQFNEIIEQVYNTIYSTLSDEKIDFNDICNLG